MSYLSKFPKDKSKIHGCIPMKHRCGYKAAAQESNDAAARTSVPRRFFFFFFFLICTDSCRPRPRCESGQFMPIRAKSGHIIQNYRNRPIQSVPAPIRPIQTETHRFKPSFKQKTLNSLPFCFSIYALLSLLALCSPLSQNHT